MPAGKLKAGKVLDIVHAEALGVKPLDALKARRALEGDLEDLDQHLHDTGRAQEILLGPLNFATLVEEALETEEGCGNKLEEKRRL